MVKRLFFLLFLLLFLTVNSYTKNEAIITGTLPVNANMLFYTNPNAGTCYAGFQDTLYADEEKNFELKFDLSQPSFILLWAEHNGKYKECKLLIEPTGNYQVNFDGEGVEIRGTNEEGQRLYSTLPNPAFISMEARKYKEENSLISIHEKILDIKKEELNNFQNLFDENKISLSFLNLIQKDRDCYYASLEAIVSLLKMYKLISNGNEQYILENGEDLLGNLKKIYTQYPPRGDDLTISTFWYEYANNYINNYQQFSQKDFDIEKLKKLYEEGVINTFFISESKKYLIKEESEFYQAILIYFTSIQNKYEKELISLFEQFKKDYPHSPYTKYLTPQVSKVIAFHEKANVDFDKEISFLDGYENMNTLEEVVKPLRGKKIYIDVWATWCGPCKREFEHAEALKKVLKEKDIQMLYISIDKDENDTQWKNQLKYHNLTGNHIRANEKLNKELISRYDEKAKEPYISIPWYIVIDENGNIIQKHATRPSEIVKGKEIFAK